MSASTKTCVCIYGCMHVCTHMCVCQVTCMYINAILHECIWGRGYEHGWRIFIMLKIGEIGEGLMLRTTKEMLVSVVVQ